LSEHARISFDRAAIGLPNRLSCTASGAAERLERTVRLTLHTDFALRVLIQVGLNDGKLTTINDIAQTFGISKAHLMKVVNDLSQKGYLDTVRGRNGGIRLMREPRHINIGQVVRDTETQLDVIGCLQREGYCCIERVCVLRGALRDASNAFLGVLNTYTLADLIKPQKALSSLLLEGRVSLRTR
jgi:Rrf2 family nitric oxide-sensitive transcriptional repressor